MTNKTAKCPKTDYRHRYYDGYYGTECRDCDFFAAYGCAPWDTPSPTKESSNE